MKLTAVTLGIGIVAAGCGGFVYTTVGGTVTGLGTGNTLVLRNEANYTRTLTADGTFSFNVASNANYAITVLTQPNTVNCAVANGTGRMTGESSVNNIAVSCTPNVQIGGTLNGMSDTGSITLYNNAATTATVTANGSFLFPNYVVNGGAYDITVGVPPAAQYCTVANGKGVASLANPAAALTASVTCIPATPVKFTVNGLTAGLVLTVANTVNGYVDNYTVTAPGNYAFGWSWLNGTPFSISVVTQPTGQTCKITGATGTVIESNPAASANIVVDCAKT